MMYQMEKPASEVEFNEELYLRSNPDIARAVATGAWPSGRVHYEKQGKAENRKIRDPRCIAASKKRKLERLQPLLNLSLPHLRTPIAFDFLTPEIRNQFNVVDTASVSSHEYNPEIQELISKHENGLVLDFGAGRRPTYYDNVVNLEIVPYDTTDVVSVGERLPFKANSFDAVVSVAVLEHVTDPFSCAREIIRVLKPGGDLLICVPFLQPLHGYPHHYYNMSHQGLKNLFVRGIDITKQGLFESTLPIWTLVWFLSSWAAGLGGDVKKRFLDMKVGELLNAPETYLQEAFVRDLSEEKNLELASATYLIGTKSTKRHGIGKRLLKKMFPRLAAMVRASANRLHAEAASGKNS